MEQSDIMDVEEYRSWILGIVDQIYNDAEQNVNKKGISDKRKGEITALLSGQDVANIVVQLATKIEIETGEPKGDMVGIIIAGLMKYATNHDKESMKALNAFVSAIIS